MKKLIFFTVLFGISAAGSFAQPPRVPAKITPRSVPFKTVTEISDADWLTLATALEKEDWKQAATLASGHLQTLKTENDKKQIAQLRYIYLFSLAGQIIVYNTQGNTTEGEKAWAEIDRVMETFIGKEFIMPPRPFTTDCEKKLNVICQVKDTPNAFRTTATNQEGNAIHSFDYVMLDQPVDIKEFNGKVTFLGGVLRRAEYNEDKTKPWVLRLFFNKGFLRVVVK
ncbi:MAG TPA: hypothetical protein VNB22_05070 [Pyrinomonadaceae bacterium]|nr:hypothetical protein [Pyrinomonadaceae bacterium]